MFSFSRKEELIDASLKGNLPKIKEILADPKYSVDTCDEKGSSLLLLSIFSKHIAVVEYLLEKKANPNLMSESGATPLIFAALFREEEMVTLLLESGAHINASATKLKQYDYLNPLFAVLIAQIQTKEDIDRIHKIIFLLLNRGADPNLPNDLKNICSPLHLAVEKELTEVVSILIEYHASVTAVDKDGQSPLHYAAKKGFVHITQILMNGIVKQQQQVLLDMLDNNHMSPLMLAASAGHEGVIQLLLQMNVNVNHIFVSDKHVYCPLLFAIQKKHHSTVLLLLKHGADPKKHLCLHLAVELNQIPVIRNLLEHGALPTTIDKQKKTPLHFAANLGNVEAIEMLFQACPKRSYLHMQDDKGNTALHLAMLNRQIKAALLLMKLGTNPFILNHANQSVDTYEPIKRQLALNQQLLAATDQGKVDEIEKLLKEGAHIEAVNNEPPHNTSLLKSIIKNDLASAKLLLQFGASIYADNANEEGVIALAQSIDMIHLILSSGMPVISTKDLQKILERMIHRQDHLFAQGILHNVLFLPFLMEPVALLSKNFITNLQHDAFAFFLKNGFIYPDMPLQTDGDPIPLLLYVAQFGNIEMMELLLGANPNLNISDKNDKTILHYMAQNIKFDLFSVFTKNNIYFKTYNPVDSRKVTPLMTAVKEGNIPGILFLLSMHANMHAADVDGESALTMILSLHFSDTAKTKKITQILCYHCMLYQPHISQEEIISIDEIEYYFKHANVTKPMFCTYVNTIAQEAYQKEGIHAKVAILENAFKKPTVLSDYMNTTQQVIHCDVVHLKMSLRKLQNSEEYQKACAPFLPPPPPYSTTAENEKIVAPPSPPKQLTHTNRPTVYFYQQFDNTNKEAETWRKQWHTRL